MEKLRSKEAYEGNPVGLNDNTAQELGKALDAHLSAFIIMWHQYHKHHWLVEGPQFRDLHLFFEENYGQVHEDYDAIAERITLLGMTPTSSPSAVAELSYIEHEPEGVYRIRESLEHDMENEKQIAVRLRDTIKKAADLGDFGTKSMLERILFRCEDRAHHCEHFLGEDTIVVGLLHDPKDLSHN